jgi:hypothetical protein
MSSNPSLFKPKGEWSKRTAEIEKIIKRLCASSKARKGGPSWGVTGASHRWTMTLQDHLDFRVLDAWSDGYVRKNQAMMALSRAMDQGSELLDAFEKHYAKFVEECEKEPRQFKFAVPLFANIVCEKGERIGARVLGVSIKLERRPSVMRQLGKRHFEEMLMKSRIPHDAAGGPDSRER